MTKPSPTRESSAEERRRKQDRQYKEAWDIWMAALSDEERARLAEMGVDGAKVEKCSSGAPGREDAWDGEFADPADSSAASMVDDPAAKLEPEEMTQGEYAAVEEAFARALLWSTEAATIVEMGRRLTVMLHVLRPQLLRGLVFEMNHAAELVEIVGAENVGGVGRMFGSVLEWMRRGPSLSAVGQRVLAMAYVMFLGQVGEMTLEEIGAPTRKTRQAVDKLVQDARDTFGGLRSRNMRDENHRTKCKNAQLLRASRN